MAEPGSIEVHNPNGKYKVVSTKPMPGTRWISILTQQDCRFEICTQKKTILSVEDIIALIGDKCDGVIGQLTEDWGETLFSALSRAGGKAFSNMAVGYNNNVDVSAANKYGVAIQCFNVELYFCVIMVQVIIDNIASITEKSNSVTMALMNRKFERKI